MVSKQLPLYSRVHISSGDLFQDSEETSHSAETNDTSYDRAACFHGDEAFFFLFQKKRDQNGQLKKNLFSSSANSQYFLSRFHGLLLGLELIDTKDIGVAQLIWS